MCQDLKTEWKKIWQKVKSNHNVINLRELFLCTDKTKINYLSIIRLRVTVPLFLLLFSINRHRISWVIRLFGCYFLRVAPA